MQTFDIATKPVLLIKTVASSSVPERLTARSISSMARSGITNRILVTTSAAHGYHTGARVYISGATEPEFNTPANGELVTVVDATTFYVAMPGTTASASGTIVCYADIWCRSALVFGQKAVRTANTGTVYLGTESTNDSQPLAIATGAERELVPDQLDQRRNLGDFYLDVATNADGVVILYS